MKKLFYLVIIAAFLQSCFVHVKKDYNGFSKTLVFNQNKKWLINKIYTDLDASQDEKLNQKVLDKFNELSGGKAVSIDVAKQQNLFPASISFAPDLEQLQTLKNSSDFDFIVNIRTKKIRDQLGSLELEKPLQYSKNSAFALLEVYDIKTLKKIYSLRAYSEMALDKKESYGEDDYRSKSKDDRDGPYFSYSAEGLSVKNLKKILSDIDKNAIK